MIKNFVRVAWRNLTRSRGFSALNLLGLTMGITCTLLIALWVNDELGYDRFQTYYQSTYKIMANRSFNNQVFTDDNMVAPLAKTLQENFPQIRNAVMTTHRRPAVLTVGEQKLKREGYTASDQFFGLFTARFIQGNAATSLPDAQSIVLSESTARALFGTTDVMGKVIRVDNETDARVTGVVQDMPGNSTIQFDYVNRFNFDNGFMKEAMNNWRNSSWDVYVRLDPEVNPAPLEKQVNELKYQRLPEDRGISQYFFFPMKRWRLHGEFKEGRNVGGMIEYVRLFSIIAIIILLIACVNFMNLSTARSEKRAREVGVRKTLGSGRRQLVLQFFFESAILSFFALLLSIGLVFLLLPSFNLLVQKQLSLNLGQPAFWLAAIAISLFTGLVAGSYPALYLSSFNPVRVLKGTVLPGKWAGLPRRMLVVGQFVVSFLLISATVIVYLQISHIKHRDIGYNPDNLLMIPASNDTQEKFAAIRDELLKTGVVNAVNRSFSPVTEIWWKTPAPEWDGKPAGQELIISAMSTDVDYARTMGVKILEGRDFSGLPADSAHVLINDAAVKAMKLKQPIGTQFRYGANSYTVIGVTSNIVMESPFRPVDPMLVFFAPGNSNSINIRLSASVQPQPALAAIENVFRKYNPAFPFEYRFVDQEFGKKFATEELIGTLTNIFAGLAIFICCLGLAGLAAFTIEKRVREIGIRKTLGASVQQVLLLVSRDFIRLVLIAFLVALPLTWWLMNNWLEKYHFRIQISIWMFAAVGVFVLLLAMLVVTVNTLRAALANPIRSLRSE